MLNYYRALLRYPAQTLFQRDSSTISQPTLLIWGEQDAALGKELTYTTGQLVSNLTIRYIPQCSHWVQEECPDTVNQHMLDFLTA